MNLVFDIGNNSTKVALFDGHERMESIRTRHFSCDKMQKIFEPYHNRIDKAIVSTVRNLPGFIIDMATMDIPFVHILNHKSKLPFTNEYETPQTLGPDRIAAVAGACFFFPGKNVLVIDAGSAVTYDFLYGKEYRGGNISPGLSLRFRALNKFTGRLPLVSTAEKYRSPGKNTVEAITAGVVEGMVYEIEEYIRSFIRSDTRGKVIITGGDSGFLKERIRHRISYMPDLVVDGLNYILELNAK